MTIRGATQPLAGANAAPVLDGEAAAVPNIQRRFVEVLGEGSRATTTARATEARPPAPTPVPAPTALHFRRTVEGLLAAEQRIDAIVNAARKGKTFTAAELLAMQSTVFRYSQTVEIVSRAADRLVGAIKQTLSTQV